MKRDWLIFRKKNSRDLSIGPAEKVPVPVLEADRYH